MHQRNVTVFADGEVDRSPCGSGTCARLAVLAADGRAAPAGPCCGTSRSSGSTFTGTVLATVDVGGRPAVVPQVTGMAYRTGEHTFVDRPARPAGARVRAPLSARRSPARMTTVPAVVRPGSVSAGSRISLAVA